MGHDSNGSSLIAITCEFILRLLTIVWSIILMLYDSNRGSLTAINCEWSIILLCPTNNRRLHRREQLTIVIAEVVLVLL